MNSVLRSFAWLFAFSVATVAPGVALAQNHRGGPPRGTRPMIPQGRTLTTPPSPVASPSKEEVKTASGEQFFIIASIDRQNSQLLLKRATEVTELVKLSPNCKFTTDGGKPATLASFRAGDTVWAKLSGEDPEPTLVAMRNGEMTVADLHKYYLNYQTVK